MTCMLCCRTSVLPRNYIHPHDVCNYRHSMRVTHVLMLQSGARFSRAGKLTVELTVDAGVSKH